MSSARTLVLTFLLLATAAWSREAPGPSPGRAATAATLEVDTARCRLHADLSACYDAIRWNPADPALLVALADALVRANRPADAIRNYHRAAALAPTMQGVAAKISAAQAKLSGRRAPVVSGNGRRYSNAAPETQSH
jgi:Flp pilus assembly protein TadD